jgi:hypothetical protein
MYNLTHQTTLNFQFSHLISNVHFNFNSKHSNFAYCYKLLCHHYAHLNILTIVILLIHRIQLNLYENKFHHSTIYIYLLFSIFNF